jgi:hypothetical protein
LHLYDYDEEAHGFSANEVATGPEPARPANAGDEATLERRGNVQITVDHEIGEARHQVPFPTNRAQLLRLHRRGKKADNAFINSE